MDKIRLVHDTVGKTLTVWLGDPRREAICEETDDEVVIIKDKKGAVIGFEILHYSSRRSSGELSVETIIKTAA